MNQFIIEDWTGNRLFDGRTFPSFLAAWEFIYAQFPNEEQFDDYFVERLSNENKKEYV